MEYRPHHQVVIVGMCGIQFPGDLDWVPELDTVVLSAVFRKVGLLLRLQWALIVQLVLRVN